MVVKKTLAKMSLKIFKKETQAPNEKSEKRNTRPQTLTILHQLQDLCYFYSIRNSTTNTSTNQTQKQTRRRKIKRSSLSSRVGTRKRYQVKTQRRDNRQAKDYHQTHWNQINSCKIKMKSIINISNLSN